MLLGQTDPAAGLAALNDLSRELDCPGCAIWQRAEFAQRADRLEEARDLYLKTLALGSEDYLAAPLMRVLAHERLGQVLEALGDSAQAAEHYVTFAEHWAEADPELQPRVQSARDRAESLRGS
jgi:hypothetical protein